MVTCLVIDLMVKWIDKVNNEGLEGIPDKPRSGRPCRLDNNTRKELEKALEKSRVEFGLRRNRWDGIMVVEYLERFHGVHLKVRQAQRWIKRLGFSLQRPIYRYVQATNEGVAEFKETIKKLLGIKESKIKRVMLFCDEAGFCLNPKLGRGTAQIMGEVEVRTIASIMQKEYAGSKLLLYRPEIAIVRRKLPTTTQYFFKIG